MVFLGGAQATNSKVSWPLASSADSLSAVSRSTSGTTVASGASGASKPRRPARRHADTAGRRWRLIFRAAHKLLAQGPPNVVRTLIWVYRLVTKALDGREAPGRFTDGGGP